MTDVHDDILDAVDRAKAADEHLARQARDAADPAREMARRVFERIQAARQRTGKAIE